MQNEVWVHLVVKAGRQNDVFCRGVPLEVADSARVTMEIYPPFGQRSDQAVLGDLPELHLQTTTVSSVCVCSSTTAHRIQHSQPNQQQCQQFNNNGHSRANNRKLTSGRYGHSNICSHFSSTISEREPALKVFLSSKCANYLP